MAHCGGHLTTLDAIIGKSKHLEFEHLVVIVDGRPLDIWLAEQTGDAEYEGLVTTLDDCMPDTRGRPVVWERLLPSVGSATVAPLLICESDLDFDCITVVVQVVRADETTVQWSRFGRDRTGEAWRVPSLVGANVDWLDGVSSLTFGVASYRQFMDDCQRLKSDWWVRMKHGERGHLT